MAVAFGKDYLIEQPWVLVNLSHLQADPTRYPPFHHSSSSLSHLSSFSLTEADGPLGLAAPLAPAGSPCRWLGQATPSDCRRKPQRVTGLVVRPGQATPPRLAVLLAGVGHVARLQTEGSSRLKGGTAGRATPPGHATPADWGLEVANGRLGECRWGGAPSEVMRPVRVRWQRGGTAAKGWSDGRESREGGEWEEKNKPVSL